MLLPYDIEVWFAELAAYNGDWFPAPVVSWLLAAGALAVVWLRPGDGMAARAVLALLAGMWMFTGVAHLWGLMAGLDFLAPIYAGFWAAQALGLALAAGFGAPRFRFGGDAAGLAGLILALAGLAAYPLALLVLGYGPPEAMPLAGTAPAPTALFTAGLLLALRPRPPLLLFLVPLGWAGVAGMSAWLLTFPPGYAVAALLVAAAGLAVVQRVWR